jgi:hypothetical protein
MKSLWFDGVDPEKPTSESLTIDARTSLSALRATRWNVASLVVKDAHPVHALTFRVFFQIGRLDESLRMKE